MFKYTLKRSKKVLCFELEKVLLWNFKEADFEVLLGLLCVHVLLNFWDVTKWFICI
jgi:hypothetical protein